MESDDAWQYFMSHKDKIRECVEQFLPRPIQSLNGPIGGPRNRYTIDDFDKAVEAKDRIKLHIIMESAWLGAPENRGVYRIAGFTEMCNLLDGTVDGFVPEDDK